MGIHIIMALYELVMGIVIARILNFVQDGDFGAERV